MRKMTHRAAMGSVFAAKVSAGTYAAWRNGAALGLAALLMAGCAPGGGSAGLSPSPGSPVGGTGEGGSSGSGTTTGGGASDPAQMGFVIIGDTGVAPPDGNLDKTSASLAEFCAEEVDCGFMLMSGDNIYPDGASGDPAIDAPLFQTLFTEPFAPFAASSPGAPIIVALGNHDWYTSRKGALAQVAFHERSRPFYMDGLFYSYRASNAHGGVDVFVIDTEMLLSTLDLPEYDYDKGTGAMVATGDTHRGGDKNALPVNAEEQAQLAWLENALAASGARWKFILAHHPLWQGRPDSKYEQSIALRELLLPMACRHADAYFAGHQHSIEIHDDDCSSVSAADGKTYAPLPVVVSGAGAKERSVSARFAAWQSSTFPQNTVRVSWGDTPGFVYATFTDDQLSITPIKVGSNGAREPGQSYSYSERAD